LKRNIINNTIGDWWLLIAYCFLFYPIRKRQPAIDNVVIESTEFPYCQIALLPDFLIF